MKTVDHNSIHVVLTLLVDPVNYGSIGAGSGVLELRDHIVSMDLNGGPCGDSTTRTHIVFVCADEPQMIRTEAHDCEVRVEILTPFACNPETENIECVVENGDDFYDLTKLMLRRVNHLL